MAGYFGSALGGALQGYNQAAQQQPENIMRMLQIQQAIRAQQLQNMQLQANMQAQGMSFNPQAGAPQAPRQAAPMIPPQAYGQVPPSYFGPQAPSPGQASVPMSHPGTVAGVGPNGIMPYKPMQAHIDAAQGSPVTNSAPIQQVQPVQQQAPAQPSQQTYAAPQDQGPQSLDQIEAVLHASYPQASPLAVKMKAQEIFTDQGKLLTQQREAAVLKQGAFGRVQPKDYTPESIRAYQQSGDAADFVPINKTEGKGTWGPLKTINGVQTQQNSVTGEIRTAVTRPPRITVSTGEGGGKSPTGYRWADAAKTQLEPIKGGPADPSNLSDAGVDFAIQQSFLGDKSAIQGLSRNPAMRARILNRIPAVAAEMNLSPTDVARQQAEFQGFTQGQRTLGQRQANIELAANVLKQFVPIAVAASDAYTRSGIKSLNDLQNAAASRTASPELRRLNASVNAVVNAYGRAVNPSGVSSDADKQHAREILDAGFSKGDFKAAADQLLVEINAELKAPGEVKAGMKSYFGGGKGAPTAAKPTVSNW